MYRIFADDTLIYDSTLEDYKIGKGQITREVGKSGQFVFSVYPDHPYYDSFLRMRTVITVYKSGRIVFRGRILSDQTDYWNNKVITCEGELGFLQDSIVRPFSYQGDHVTLFEQFVTEHNAQVDEFKRFKIGTVTVTDNNEYINRSAQGYGTTLDMMTSALPGSALGGYFYITHGDDGTDPVPTLHYVSDFPKRATQAIEFGTNLKDYTKTVKAEDFATAIIPLGAENGSGGARLTVASVNGGKDFIYDAEAVALYGWIFQTVEWDDVVLAQNLLTKAKAYLTSAVKQHTTIELTAIDLHLLDRSIESYEVAEYVSVISKPHGLKVYMLCNKQTLDLLKPENDSVVLGYATATFTDGTNKMVSNVSTLGQKVSSVQQTAESIELSVQDMEKNIGQTLRVGADGVTIVNGEGSAIVIDGGQINAENLNLSGSITFGSLSQEVQEDINDAYAMASDAQSAMAEWSVETANGTYIDGGMIYAESIYADALHLGGDLCVYETLEGNDLGGMLGYTTSALDGSAGMHLLSADGKGEVVVTDNGAKIMYLSESNQVYVAEDAAGISVSGLEYMHIYGNTDTVVLRGGTWDFTEVMTVDFTDVTVLGLTAAGTTAVFA